MSSDTPTAMLSAFRAVLYQREEAPFTEGAEKERIASISTKQIHPSTFHASMHSVK